MANIQVQMKTQDDKRMIFNVTVEEKGSSTQHVVTVDEQDYEKLTHGKIKPDELVKKSFEFLLERESKESILRQFNLSVISHYFPEYENTIRSRE